MIDGETLMGEGEGEITIRDKKPLVNPKKIKKNIKTKRLKITRRIKCSRVRHPCMFLSLPHLSFLNVSIRNPYY